MYYPVQNQKCTFCSKPLTWDSKWKKHCTHCGCPIPDKFSEKALKEGLIALAITMFIFIAFMIFLASM